MKTIEEMLKGNQKWAKLKASTDPGYFDHLASGQQPKVLWIGCSDSRVPANEVTLSEPGDVFVHRNIANMVVHTDMNMLSVLDFGVNVLKVKHVVVCGHYLCGGVKAAMEGRQHGVIDNWIRHIKDVYRTYEKELSAIEDTAARFDKFVELNVYEQVFDLSKTSIIQNAWENRNEPRLHGWVFDPRTGLIKDLQLNFDSKHQLPDIYKMDDVHSK